MSILDILEAHDDYGFDPVGDSMRQVCMCGTDCGQATRNPDGVHRAHVAQVLEQHVLEAKAEVLTNAAAEYERLCRIGDTPQSQVTDEETQEFWIWHAKTTDEWLRDRAEQIRRQP